MDQLRDLADPRLANGCTYCGGSAETRDHVPARILLDLPLPDNLPVVPACFQCNNGFARDEEYVACLVGCAIAGCSDPERIENRRVAHTLRRSPPLRALLEAARSELEGSTTFLSDDARVRNVARKLATGHAAFELSAKLRSEPTEIVWWPLSLMTIEQRDNFDDLFVVGPLGEVGSRTTQRMQVLQLSLRSETGVRDVALVVSDWVEVQEGVYRYLAIDGESETRVKIVLRELLAIEVVWDKRDNSPSDVDDTAAQTE